MYGNKALALQHIYADDGTLDCGLRQTRRIFWRRRLTVGICVLILFLLFIFLLLITQHIDATKAAE